MQRVCRCVDPVREALVNAEGELVVDVVRETLPLQDELDDSRPHRGREEVRAFGVESAGEKCLKK